MYEVSVRESQCDRDTALGWRMATVLLEGSDFSFTENTINGASSEYPLQVDHLFSNL